MISSIPQEVATAIKKIVFAEADKINYLALSRSDSSAFLNALVVREDVGAAISKFTGRERVRHYIKDAILNRYSKDKAKAAFPDDPIPIIKEACGLEVEKSPGKGQARLYRSMMTDRSTEYVVIVEGAYLKWETALRKALLFISGKPFSEKASKIHILLFLFSPRPIPESDKKHLSKALHRCGASPHIF